MQIVSVSKAKPRIGSLIDRVIAGETVIIRKGEKMVQLLEFVVPEPIPERPVGYFRRKGADYEVANKIPLNAAPVR